MLGGTQTRVKAGQRQVYNTAAAFTNNAALERETRLRAPETGFEEINSDFLEADFWPAPWSRGDWN